MRLSNRFLPLACAAALLIGVTGTAHAVCQVPLAIGSTAADANVLVLLDTSGSMNEALMSPAYNPNTNWSGNFSRTSTYTVSTTGTYKPRSFNNSWPLTPTATLVTSDGGQDAQYNGNYLNWVFFHATTAQRGAIPVVTRIQAMKPVVVNMLANITNCRFAIERFNGSNGGTILCNFGTSVASMQSTVQGLSATDWTPLGEALITGLNYFAQTGMSAPITTSCQKSFVIIVTDGLPTQDSTFPNYIHDSNHDGYYLDDVAKYGYRTDLHPELDGIQNVATFTIGFNVDDNLLQLTADNGGGEYYTITDASGLDAALQQSFVVIGARISAGAAVSVVSSEDRTNNRLYRARYESQTWKGFLEAFNLPYHAGNSPLWEAGSILASRDPSTRIVYTSTTGTDTYNFNATNAATLRPLMGAADVATATNIINYTRGAAVTGARDRSGWKLGDIVDAAPVAVGRPNLFYNSPEYWAFRAAKANRPEAVYVAANDGMLHCIDASSGSELWAYVPKNQLSKLSDLMSATYCHEYFLNTTPVAYDIFMGGAWKTVLIGAEGAGGNGLFAIDVTSPAPDSIHVLWDVDLPQLKGSWNPPTLVRDQTRNAFVLAVGSGYDTTTAQTNLFTIDPSNGAILNTLALGSPVRGNKTTRANAIDSNFDGNDNLMYLGDLSGKLWRVNVAANPWTATVLFNGSQPIQATPVLTQNSLSQTMVFFGTGKYLTLLDPPTTGQQTIYGITDDNSGGSVTTANLVDQSSTFHAIGSGVRGWYLNLTQVSGERVTHNASLIAGTLYVPSFQPNGAACTGGGQSWLYSLDYKDGSAPDLTNNVPNNVLTDRVQSMGDGILADPSVDLVSEQIILQSSNAVLLTESIGGGVKKLIVRSWRQKWN